MFWIALAAQLSAPLPTNVSAWMTPDDVPSQMLKKEQETVVGVRVLIDPTGRKRECQAYRSSGSQKLDFYTCSLMMKRAKFLPAHDAAGVPATGVYQTFIGWWVGEGYPPDMRVGDIELEIGDMPKRSKSPAFVRVMFAVDANGTPSACIAEPDRGLKLSDENPVLVQIACDNVVKTYRAQPARDSSGVPIPSQQDATIIFIRSKR